MYSHLLRNKLLKHNLIIGRPSKYKSPLSVTKIPLVDGVLGINQFKSSNASLSKTIFNEYESTRSFHKTSYICCNSSTQEPVDESSYGEESIHESEVTELSTHQFFEGIVDEDSFSINHLTSLFPESKDPIVLKILSSTSIEQVLQTIASVPEDQRSLEQNLQALVTVADLRRILLQYEPSVKDLQSNSRKHQHLLDHLSRDPTFQEVLSYVNGNAGLFPDNILVSTLVAMQKLNFSATDPKCEKMLDEVLRRKSHLNALVVAKTFFFLRNESSLYGDLCSIQLFPRLKELIDQMKTSEEVRLISTAVRNICRNIPFSLIQAYRDRLSIILNTPELENKIDGLSFARILLCLSDTRYNQLPNNINSSKKLIKQVGQLFESHIEELSVTDVGSLARVLEFGSSEPPSFVKSLNNRISRLIEESEDIPSLDIASCLSPTSGWNIAQRKVLASNLEHYLDTENFEYTSHMLLRIVKVVRFVDDTLTHRFWGKATSYISTSTDPRVVLKVCLEYLNFVGGTKHKFRDVLFEAKAKQLIYFYIFNYQRQIQPTLFSPSELSKALAFLIAFSWHSEPVFLEVTYGLADFFSKMILDSCRAFELFALARGISTSISFQKNNRRCPERYFHSIMKYSDILRKCISTRLNEGNLQIPELLTLLKTQAIIKEASSHSINFNKSLDQVIDKLNLDSLDSKEARDLISILNNSNFYHPQLHKQIQEFILQNPNSISTEVAERYLSFAYNLGLEPESEEDYKVFKICGDVIEMNWESLSQFGLVYSCLSLIFANSLTKTSLITNIFSIDFLNELDDEIKHNNWNRFYTYRLRKLLMQLNRVVCLDLPSANVPWFHQKYCEALYANANLFHTSETKEVGDVLKEIIPEVSIQSCVSTPYFYNIDYVIEFDKEGKPLKKTKSRRLLALPSLTGSSTPDRNEGDIGEKVGIVVLPPTAFTEHVRRLKGIHLLRKRHLEILGYRVIQIDPCVWNSMWMSEPLAKNHYLERLIYRKSTNGTVNQESGTHPQLNLV